MRLAGSINRVTVDHVIRSLVLGPRNHYQSFLWWGVILEDVGYADGDVYEYLVRIVLLIHNIF